MPVLRAIRERFEVEKPLAGHADVGLLARNGRDCQPWRGRWSPVARSLSSSLSNPLSTQDDVAASLVQDFNIPVYAIKGEDESSYYRHIAAAAQAQPERDDGRRGRPGQCDDLHRPEPAR